MQPKLPTIFKKDRRIMKCQSAAQTETDRQECSRWATTQPRAMADASVFQHAVAACMDGRGYTTR